MVKICGNCKHRTKFVEAENRDNEMYICTADGWEDNGDGSHNLLEVSDFDARECLLFCAS